MPISVNVGGKVCGGRTDAAVLADYRVYQERRNLRAATITNRAWALAAFIRHILPRSLLDATADDVQSWLDSRVLSPKSRSCDISTLHCFYDFCARQGLIDADPTLDVVKPRLRRTLPRPISTDALNRAMVFATPMLRAWLALAAFEGLRCAEIAGLRREDIDEARELLFVCGKGGHERVLPLNPIAHRMVLATFPPSVGPLFVCRGRAYTPNRVSQLISSYFASLGIAATAHQLRHHFASECYSRCHDLRLVQELLGHASPTTTAIYVAFSPGEAAAVVRDLGLT